MGFAGSPSRRFQRMLPAVTQRWLFRRTYRPQMELALHGSGPGRKTNLGNPDSDNVPMRRQRDAVESHLVWPCDSPLRSRSSLATKLLLLWHQLVFTINNRPAFPEISLGMNCV
jgi:hypothetical protein